MLCKEFSGHTSNMFDIVDKLVCDGYGFTVKLNFKLKTI